MNTKSFKLHYEGSLFWLIFWLVIFFPIALVLLLTASSFNVNGKTLSLKYRGSRFWLCFWILAFFPVAFLLLFLNGFSADFKKQEDEEVVLIIPNSKK